LKKPVEPEALLKLALEASSRYILPDISIGYDI
jgi:hypothetical protein